MSLQRFFRTPGTAIPARQKAGWIGIDIGTASIKVAQVERSGRHQKLARSLVVRAPADRPFGPADLENGRISQQLKDALKTRGGFVGSEAACLISMAHCQMRTLVRARGSEVEQRELISLEIENERGVASQPMEFEFWDAESSGPGESRGMQQIHVLSVPQSAAEALASSLLRVQLQCQVLDAVPFAAMRAAQMSVSAMSLQESDHPFAVLDWGSSVATLIVVANGTPFLTRPLKHCGTRRMMEALSHRLKLSQLETETLLTTYGMPHDLAGSRYSDAHAVIAELVAGTLSEVLDEIRETLDFLQLQFPDQTPRQLWLTGGGAAIRNIDASFQSLQLPVRSWGWSEDAADCMSPLMANAVALSSLAWEL